MLLRICISRRSRRRALAGMLGVAAAMPATVRAQYGAPEFCPLEFPTAGLVWQVKKVVGFGTVGFRDGRNYPLTLNLGYNYKYIPPNPKPSAFQDGTRWAWNGAAVSFDGCVREQAGGLGFLVVIHPQADPLSRAVPLYAPRDPDPWDGGGDTGNGEPSNCGGGGGGTQFKASSAYTFSADEVMLAVVSCGGGGGDGGLAPAPPGQSGQCLLAGCYDVFIDGAYAGSFCLDRDLCFRV